MLFQWVFLRIYRASFWVWSPWLMDAGEMPLSVKIRLWCSEVTWFAVSPGAGTWTQVSRADGAFLLYETSDQTLGDISHSSTFSRYLQSTWGGKMQTRFQVEKRKKPFQAGGPAWAQVQGWEVMGLLWEIEDQFGKDGLGTEGSWRPEVCGISWNSGEILKIIK